MFCGTEQHPSPAGPGRLRVIPRTILGWHFWAVPNRRTSQGCWGRAAHQATAITGFALRCLRCRSPTTTSSTPSWAAGTKNSSRKSNPTQQGEKIPVGKKGRSSCPTNLPFHPSTGTCWACSFQVFEGLKHTIISTTGKPRLGPTTTSATELYPVLPAARRICFSITQKRHS